MKSSAMLYFSMLSLQGSVKNTQNFWLNSDDTFWKILKILVKFDWFKN